MVDESERVTDLLLAWGQGDDEAGERLAAEVHRTLKLQAARALRAERADHTLQPTALVNEAWMRLVDQQRVQWQGRGQFYGIAAQMMRRILVDHARRRRAQRRGGDPGRVPLDEVEPWIDGRPEHLLALDAALDELSTIDRRRAQIVELRYFAGLEVQEIAALLGIGTATVNRQWRAARAFLRLRLAPTA
ncbi:MAG: ECF-type sigma factor [Acidobacteriota bacterium]